MGLPLKNINDFWIVQFGSHCKLQPLSLQTDFLYNIIIIVILYHIVKVLFISRYTFLIPLEVFISFIISSTLLINWLPSTPIPFLHSVFFFKFLLIYSELYKADRFILCNDDAGGVFSVNKYESFSVWVIFMRFVSLYGRRWNV